MGQIHAYVSKFVAQSSEFIALEWAGLNHYQHGVLLKHKPRLPHQELLIQVDLLNAHM